MIVYYNQTICEFMDSSQRLIRHIGAEQQHNKSPVQTLVEVVNEADEADGMREGVGVMNPGWETGRVVP